MAEQSFGEYLKVIIDADRLCRQAILDWAASPGFAAVHTGTTTNDVVADHLIRSLWEAGFKIVPLKDGDLF